MGSTVALYLIVALAVGGYVGWHLRTARGASADLRVYKNRMPGFRRVRNRSGLVSLVVVVLALLAVRALIG